MEVTAGLAESNGSLLPGIWRDSLQVTCGLTACTLGSAPGPTLGNEYGKTLPFLMAMLASDRGQMWLIFWPHGHKSGLSLNLSLVTLASASALMFLLQLPPGGKKFGLSTILDFKAELLTMTLALWPKL